MTLVELWGMEPRFLHGSIDRLSCRFIEKLSNVANQLEEAD
jgi:hypothetical protein